MSEFTNEDFIKFIESYKNKTYEDEYYKIHKCYDTVTELSRSDTDRADPLVKNSKRMYGLDWMVKCSNFSEPPKSTDALFFRENEKGILELHLIEFKFLGNKNQRDKINILWNDIKKRVSCEKSKNKLSNSKENHDKFNADDCESEECFNDFFVRDFKLIRNNFNDPIAVSLKLKPYEVIFITLPKLYEEYCNDYSDVVKKDINSYLNSIDKYYWAFLGNLSPNYLNIKRKTDKYDEYSKRLEMTIFKKASVRPRQCFNKTLDREILGNFDFNF